MPGSPGRGDGPRAGQGRDTVDAARANGTISLAIATREDDPAIRGAPLPNESRRTRFDGAEFATLSERLGGYFGVKAGVLVVRAGANSPFKLQDGDVILAIDGRDATTAAAGGPHPAFLPATARNSRCACSATARRRTSRSPATARRPPAAQPDQLAAHPAPQLGAQAAVRGVIGYDARPHAPRRFPLRTAAGADRPGAAARALCQPAADP